MENDNTPNLLILFPTPSTKAGEVAGKEVWSVIYYSWRRKWDFVNIAVARDGKESVYAKAVAKIHAPDIFVCDHFGGGSMHQNCSIV